MALDLNTKVKLRTGRGMPVIGLGTWQLTRDTAGTIETALKLGYPLIDTSGDYGTQPGIGEGIRRSRLPREGFYLTTKVEAYEDTYRSTRRSLRELGLAFADLVLLHWPPAGGAGEDLWRGLMRARDEGLTRDIGVSNFKTSQIEALVEATGEVPAVNQIEWSPFGHSDDMRRYCDELGIVIQAYSPLSRTSRLSEEGLAQLAARYRCTPAQLLIRWSMQRGCVPLPKANSRSHLEENLDVFDFDINEPDMEDLDALNEHYSALGRRLYYV